jgi:hypothetical protein
MFRLEFPAAPYKPHPTFNDITNVIGLDGEATKP